MEKNKKWFSESTKPFGSCRSYNIPLYQCPQFLFLVMGVIIILAIILTYSLTIFKVGDPRVVSLIILVITAILLVLDYIIVNSFERVAEAAKMKTEFIGIVSHQLRSPLTNIKFSLEVLMSGELKNKIDDELEYMKILRENTQRMGDLINDLILVSRIETGEFPLNKLPLDLAEIVQGIVKKFKPFAEASNVDLNLKIQGNTPKVLADALWLEQIAKNLIDNAVRYIKGKGQVNIFIEHNEKEIFFKIEDTGVGIPEAEQRYIFKKFFRSKNAIRHQTEGSGLGLHIVKKLLEFFFFFIWFDSKEEKGTTFYFTLPVYRGEKIA
ncbi:MAG: HAMP domain-containing sensor histidine kinase [Candidatus Gribaldobacteria bacterium]|nr:HAMP domain-containing sensor histidine kinase [Candidatus Gribaldobacteria bacterium]